MVHVHGDGHEQFVKASKFPFPSWTEMGRGAPTGWNATRAFVLRWKVASVACYKSGHALLVDKNNTTRLDTKILVIGAFGMRARNFKQNFGNQRGVSFSQSVADFFGWTRPNSFLSMPRKTSSSRGIL